MADSPILRTANGDFVLGERFVKGQPTSELPSFLEGYEEFVNSSVDQSRESVLDAGNFVLLTGILEALTGHTSNNHG
jgi:hypothetical protein